MPAPRQIIEALLFASEKPITSDQIREVLDNSLTPGAIRSLLNELNAEYLNTNRAFNIIEIAGGFQLATNPEYAPWLKKMFHRVKEDKLSRPSLETLAIIAYKQPISRVEIEQIRGVDSEGVLKTLLEKGLIKIMGRKDAPGRPLIYGTTKEFLQYFGLNSISQLPELEQAPKIEAQNELQNQAKPITQQDR